MIHSWNRRILNKNAVPFRLWLWFAGVVGIAFSTGVNGPLGINFHPSLILIASYVLHPTTVSKTIKNIQWDFLSVSAIFIAISAIAFAFVALQPLPSLYRASMLLLSIGSFLSLRAEMNTVPNNRNFISFGLEFAGLTLASYYLINLTIMCIAFGPASVLVERYVGGLSSLPWGASNVIAAALLIALTASLSNMPLKETWISRVRPYFSIIIVAGILATLSRTVSILAIFILIFFFLKSEKKMYKLFCIAVAASAVAYIFPLYVDFDSDALVRLIEDRTSTDKIRDLNNRSDIWNDSIKRIVGYPLEPFGYYGSLDAVGSSSHNALLTSLVEQTAIGALPFICLWLWLFINGITRGFSWRVESKHAKGKVLSIGSAVIAANLLFEDPHYTAPYLIFFWTLLSIFANEVEGQRCGRFVPWACPKKDII